MLLLAAVAPSGLGAAKPGGPPVYLELVGCDHLATEDVRRMVELELEAHLVDAPSSGVTDVRAVCESEYVQLRVLDPLTRKQVKRRVPLLDPEAEVQARLLALATAELVLASWTELALNPEPKVEPAGVRPNPELTEQARASVHRRAGSLSSPFSTRKKQEPITLRIMALGSTRRFFRYDGPLYGGGVRVGNDHPGVVSWMLDTLFETGEVTADLGDFYLDTATLGGAVYLYERWSWIVARLGAGLRLGVGSSGPQHSEAPGGSALVTWGWPLAAASVGLHPPGGVVFEASAEAGYVVLPLSGFREPSLRGSWFGVQLGVGFSP